MKRVALLTAFWIALSGIATSQAKPETKPAAPAPIAVSMTSENRILKAEHDLDVIQDKMKDMIVQYDQIQKQLDDLKVQYQAEQGKEATAKKAVDDAIEAAWKDSGLDKAKYDFDAAGFKFVEKKIEPKK